LHEITVNSQGYLNPFSRIVGGPKTPSHPKFLENIVILCFERRFSKQNSVIRQHGFAIQFSKSFGNHSRRHGGFGGLNPPKKLQMPQN